MYTLLWWGLVAHENKASIFEKLWPSPVGFDPRPSTGNNNGQFQVASFARTGHAEVNQPRKSGFYSTINYITLSYLVNFQLINNCSLPHGSVLGGIIP